MALARTTDRSFTWLADDDGAMYDETHISSSIRDRVVRKWIRLRERIVDGTSSGVRTRAELDKMGERVIEICK